MGRKLTSDTTDFARDAIPRWLDAATRALIADVVETLVSAYPDVRSISFVWLGCAA
ncbi:MAG: hypothetical protein ACHQ4H_00870 [Ktedonobacterales bacterium]